MLQPGVYAHGDNSAGQCGLGHTDDVYSIDDFTHLERNLIRMRLPADDDEPGSHAPATLDRAETDWPVQVACGRRHTVVLTASGNVLGCGENASGQLSHAHAGQLWWLTPQFWPFPSGHRAMRVACGGDHTTIITTSGAAFSCGANDSGQLGIGLSAEVCHEARRLTPVPMPGFAVVLDAACGDAHTIFLVALAAAGPGADAADGLVLGEGGGEGGDGREAYPETSESELAAVMAATAAAESGLGEADLESIDRGLRRARERLARAEEEMGVLASSTTLRSAGLQSDSYYAHGELLSAGFLRPSLGARPGSSSAANGSPTSTLAGLRLRAAAAAALATEAARAGAPTERHEGQPPQRQPPPSAPAPEPRARLELTQWRVGLFGCGSNERGQLGLGRQLAGLNLAGSLRLPSHGGSSDGWALACGALHSVVALVLRGAGRGSVLFGCGANGSGQLGTGDVVDRFGWERLDTSKLEAPGAPGADPDAVVDDPDFPDPDDLDGPEAEPEPSRVVAHLSCGRDVTALVTSRHELFACGNTGEPSRLLRRVALSPRQPVGEPPALLRPLSVACGSSWRETACVCAEQGSRLVVRLGELPPSEALPGLAGEALERPPPESSEPSPHGAAVACGGRHVCVLIRGLATPAPLAGAVLDVRRRLAQLDRFRPHSAPDAAALARASTEPRRVSLRPSPTLAAQLAPLSAGLPRAAGSSSAGVDPNLEAPLQRAQSERLQQHYDEVQGAVARAVEGARDEALCEEAELRRAAEAALDDARRETELARATEGALAQLNEAALVLLERQLRASLSRVQTRLAQLVLKEESRCPVCLDAERDTALVPCGHRFCASCVGRLLQDACPYCKAPIASRLRVY